MITTMPDRTLQFMGGIHDDSIKGLLQKITELLKGNRDDWISLLITSAGGTASMGLSFFEFVTLVAKPKLQAVALAEVSSMGIIMFLAGTHRVITPNATLFFHEPMQTLKKETTHSLSEVRTLLESLESVQKKYADIVVQCSGGKLSDSELREMMHRNTFMTAKEALELGLAHEIIGQ